METTRPARTRAPAFPAGFSCALPILIAAALPVACGGGQGHTTPPPGADIRVMAEVERFTESGASLADVSVVVSLEGDPVTGAEVTLNGRAVPPSATGHWYRGSGLPLADLHDVVVQVNSSVGSRTLTGVLPGKVTLRQPLEREVIPDDAPISVSWDPVSWDSVATPHEITVEFTQGNPFHLVTLPSDAVTHQVAASETSPSPMDFVLVTAWAGHADPGNPDRGDWLGQDGLRLGSRAFTWVEIAE